MLQAHNHHHGPLLYLLQYVCIALVLGSAELDTALEMLFTSARQRGRITFLHLLAILLLMQPRIPLAFFTARAHGWFMFSLVSTRTPRASSVKLLSSWFVPSLHWCSGFSWDRVHCLPSSWYSAVF